MLFYPLHYDIIRLNKSKNHTGISFITWFAENQIVLWDFKIRDSIQITEGSDNGDSDNQGSTVYVCI